jgi:hypothetical protein
MTKTRNFVLGISLGLAFCGATYAATENRT